MKIESSKRVWVTSDLHFNHVNLAGPTVSKWDVGFRHFDSVDQMNETIITNLNSVVEKDDILIVLGDIIMGAKPEIHLPQFLNRINCKTIHAIKGNHDDVICRTPQLQQLFTSWNVELLFTYQGRYFHAYHPPLGSWYKIGHGSINLFGHCHSNYSRVFGRQIDVGLDCNNFFPYKLDDIIHKMELIPVVSPDHHGSSTSYH